MDDWDTTKYTTAADQVPFQELCKTECEKYSECKGVSYAILGSGADPNCQK